MWRGVGVGRRPRLRMRRRREFASDGGMALLYDTQSLRDLDLWPAFGNRSTRQDDASRTKGRLLHTSGCSPQGWLSPLVGYRNIVLNGPDTRRAHKR